MISYLNNPYVRYLIFMGIIIIVMMLLNEDYAIKILASTAVILTTPSYFFLILIIAIFVSISEISFSKSCIFILLGISLLHIYNVQGLANYGLSWNDKRIYPLGYLSHVAIIFLQFLSGMIVCSIIILFSDLLGKLRRRE